MSTKQVAIRLAELRGELQNELAGIQLLQDRIEERRKKLPLLEERIASLEASIEPEVQNAV